MARRSSSTLHVEVDLAGVGVIERPSSVLVLLPGHQVDGLSRSFIGTDPGFPQVVQTPKDVVVPASGKREFSPVAITFPVAIDHFPVDRDLNSFRSSR